jgi:hypothetical protein
LTSVEVSVSSSGTATAGADYVSLSATVTIPAGLASTTVAVTPVDDSLDEPDETVTLTLSPGSGYVVATSSSRYR